MLSDIKIKAAKPAEKQYKIADSDGLYILIHPNGSRYWRFDYTFASKRKTLAIGKYPRTTLKDARQARSDAQQLIDRGLDPITEKKKRKEQIREDHANTFETVARDWYEKQLTEWSEAHAHKVWRRIEMHVFPVLGPLPIRSVTPRNVIDCIERIQARGALDIAKRALQSIKSILTYAAIHEMCERSAIMDLEPQHLIKSRPVQNNPHLEEKDLAEFFKKLNQDESAALTQLAMRLVLLTFVRSGELREAKWDEFDFKRRMWKIPKERMKMATPHLVPLSKQSVAVLNEIKAISGVFDYVFPQERNPRRCMSDATLTRVLHRTGYRGRLTVHGVRGTASTILHEHGFNPEHIERQLSHMERNKIKAAYNHAEYLEDRTTMMQWWADFLEGKGLTTSL